MVECTIDSANAVAFLKLIRFAEHMPNDGDDLYYVIYGGGRFADTSKHPNVATTRWGHTSTAAGAYQILFSTWAEAKRKGLVTDFTPAAQDTIAFAKLKSRGALAAVCDGNVALAVTYLGKEWTSLPTGAQTRMSVAAAEAAFVRYGGKKP